MSFTVVKHPPKGIELSQNILAKVRKRLKGRKHFGFFQIWIYGHAFYVPITNATWDVLGLTNEDFSTHKKTKEVTCTKPGVEEFLREFIDAISLQIRDDLLDGVEDKLTAQMMDQVEQSLRTIARDAADKAIQARFDKVLPAGTPNELGVLPAQKQIELRADGSGVEEVTTRNGSLPQRTGHRI